MGLQLGFKTLQQGKGIGGTTGETGQHLASKQAVHLAGIAFHDGIAKRNLAIAANDHLTIATDGDDSCH